VKSLITKVGQTSEGMGASQSTAYKIRDWCENDRSKDRTDDSYVYAARMKLH
jgi:HAE1 family hydrophobic/amphiphilic exporter-1